MRRSLALVLCLFPALALPACSGGDSNAASLDGGVTDGSADLGPARTDGSVPLGEPLTTPKNQWTWVDFPDAVCDDGTPTGIGVQLTDSKNLVIYLEGGGACWEDFTCSNNFSVHGPFGKSQWNANGLSGLNRASDSIFDDGDAQNPFRGWNKVYVPYCTSDVHAGDAVQTFTNSGTMHFKGRANMRAFLSRIAATLPSPDKLVFTGSSAGGFGSAFDYDLARSAFTPKQAYLLDDSGPIFEEDGLPVFAQQWLSAWNLGPLLYGICPDCMDGDWSLAIDALVAKYPNDRLALLETLQDGTISGYFFQDGPTFQNNLETVTADHIDPHPNFHYFYQAGNGHTMLHDLSQHTVGGVNVRDWIGQMVNDDTAWKSVKP